MANRWLGLFVFIIGCAFVSTYMLHTDASSGTDLLFKILTSLQFLSGPCLYFSIRYFGNPAKKFSVGDSLHGIPFLVFFFVEVILRYGDATISVYPLFVISDTISFLVRDLLPFLLLGYLIVSYRLLKEHEANLERIASAVEGINLRWLKQLLVILLLALLTWINDALFELPGLTQATTYLYAVAVFFLAWFAIRQKAIFVFSEEEMTQIAELLEEKPAAQAGSKPPEGEGTPAPETTPAGTKPKRLSDERIAALSEQLTVLLEKDKLYLDNELNLPAVAARLGISIHETSFLINATTRDNFYNLINRYRVEEAKRLLASSRIAELNILGIAFSSGFNSKTAFNTAFRKWTGLSPSAYVKNLKNLPQTGSDG